MLNLEFPKPVKFICGFIYPDPATFFQVKKILIKKFGQVDFESKKIDFNHTEYYYSEMGKPLFRSFLSFQKLRKPEEFIKIKLFCLKNEKKFAKNNKRIINIDPGYLNAAKLILTTTKDFSHRIYLGKGVYAETTLLYQEKTYKNLATTFPDYRTPLYKDIFKEIRSIYINQIKAKYN